MYILYKHNVFIYLFLIIFMFYIVHSLSSWNCKMNKTVGKTVLINHWSKQSNVFIFYKPRQKSESKGVKFIQGNEKDQIGKKWESAISH